MSEQAVVHVEVDLGTHGQVRVLAGAVGEVVEGKHHGAVGGVLEGDDAVGGAAGLRCVEDVFSLLVIILLVFDTLLL